jgi:sugar phosphate isomerase/epimerase
MKRLLFTLLLSAGSAFAGDFAGKAGLQLYSLRESFKKDVPGSLDKVKALGFTEVETATTYGLPNDKYLAELKARGLTPISGHFQYEALTKDLPGVIAQAKALGLQYVACPWIPHTIAEFDEATARKAAADFNAWGEACAKEGLRFTYHPHGYEFVTFGEGTLFDLLLKETKPEAVAFEMDVFWVMHSGVDPVKLLEKYPNRWALMHLKDIRKGAKTGFPTGRAPLTDDVALGTGMTDWPAVLRTAAKVGIKHYFIEDESPTVEEQLPVTLKYLETLK